MTQDPTRLGSRVVALLWIWLAADIGFALAALQEIHVLRGMSASPGNPDLPIEPTTLGAITGLFLAVASIAAGIGVLRWIYVTNRNAQSWNTAMSLSPGWNVGWFFVPIANLWKPFEGVRETYAVTVDPHDPGGVPIPLRLRCWWGLWIATSLLGNITFRLSLRADTPEELIVVDWLYVAGIVIDLPLAIALVRLIREISSRQRHRLTLEAFP